MTLSLYKNLNSCFINLNIVRRRMVMAKQHMLSALCCFLLVYGQSEVIKKLPGFEGDVPFEMETGYEEVTDDVHLFYYFVKSEGNPVEDPLLLWLTGGPGCSAFSAFMYEIGPLHFKNVEHNGRLPTLELNPHSWTKVANIIFVDLPVGTGFSYATTQSASKTGDFSQAHHALLFLRKWLIGHPEFLSNPVYIGGDSYSGLTLPIVVHSISTGNEEGIEPLIKLQGYLLGNPLTIPSMESNSKIPFSHGMGLISDELYQSMKTTCRGEYQYPSNEDCFRDIQAYQKCTSGIEGSHILEPSCPFVSPKPHELREVGTRRSLNDKYKQLVNSQHPIPPFGCRSYGYALSYLWFANETVLEALHIRKGSVNQWVRCNFELPYTYQSHNTFEYHVNLSVKGYRSLIYSGDHDMIVPFLGTQAWIRLLNYTIVDDWRQWVVQGQVAGYTRTYSNRMTFATLKGGGHTAPEYTPQQCFAMFKRWVSQEPL